MSPTSPSKAAVLLRRTRSERSSDLRRAHSAIGTSCCTPNDHRTIANTHAPDATRHPQCHRLRCARAVAHGRAVLYIILVRHETKTETARYSAPSDSSIPVMTSSVRAREPSAEARERDRETFHLVCSHLLLYTTALEHFRRARGHVAGVVSTCRRKTQEAKRPKTGAGARHSLNIQPSHSHRGQSRGARRGARRGPTRAPGTAGHTPHAGPGVPHCTHRLPTDTHITIDTERAVSAQRTHSPTEARQLFFYRIIANVKSKVSGHPRKPGSEAGAGEGRGLGTHSLDCDSSGREPCGVRLGPSRGRTRLYRPRRLVCSCNLGLRLRPPSVHRRLRLDRNLGLLRLDVSLHGLQLRA